MLLQKEVLKQLKTQLQNNMIENKSQKQTELEQYSGKFTKDMMLPEEALVLSQKLEPLTGQISLAEIIGQYDDFYTER